MPHPTSQPQRILIVERDHPISDLLHIFLEQGGYVPIRVDDLEAAYNIIEQQSFDLVVMDPFAQPGQPRLAEAERLKRRCAPTPVGIITGWHIPTEEAKQAGFAFILEKPFDFDSLLHRIADLLSSPFTPEQQKQAHVMRRYLEALSASDWETLRKLCTPDMGYFLLTRSAFTIARDIQGFEAYLAYAQYVRSRVSDLRLEQVAVFHHPTGLIARYSTSFTGSDGQRKYVGGSLKCYFRGERIALISVSQLAQPFRAFLEAPQSSPGIEGAAS